MASSPFFFFFFFFLACSFFQNLAVSGTQSLESPDVHAENTVGAIDDGLARLNVSRKRALKDEQSRQPDGRRSPAQLIVTTRRPDSSALEENVQAIKRWETRNPAGAFESRAGQRLDCLHGRQWAGARAARRLVRRLGDRERRRDPRVRPFDPFPFPFLTMTVSLEAIFLALFVLASQNRLARQADKRSHLDLQIDLLAEREMTAVLQLLQDIARHLDVQTTVTPEQLRDLMKKTDLRRLTDRMEELAEPARRAALPKAVRQPRMRRRHDLRRHVLDAARRLSICSLRSCARYGVPLVV